MAVCEKLYERTGHDYLLNFAWEGAKVSCLCFQQRCMRICTS